MRREGRRLPTRPAAGRVAVAAAGIILLAAAIEILRPRSTPTPLPGGIPTAVRSARVAFVADGDTVRTEDGEWIRYLGIDAPERGDPFADEATRRNEALVLDRTIRIREGPSPTDGYGRTVAWILRDDDGGKDGDVPTSVNERLVLEGLAWVSLHPENLDDTERLIRAQIEAIDGRRGLWADPPRAAPYYLSSRFRFHRPDCPAVRGIANPRRHPDRWEPLREGKAPCRTCRP
ncbi:MAG: thermonuclease family protein [Planctomycetes bacterium]|nr:thermonuclease family protein [Planctomycetota bacterium]